MSSKRSWKPRVTKAVQGPRSGVQAFLAFLGYVVLGTLHLLGAQGARIVETLTPSGGLPPNLIGQMRTPAAFVETPTGAFIVFDSRSHEVYGVDAAKTRLKKLVTIGPSDGQILNPDGFTYSSNRTFTIVDAPGKYERVQTFYDDGTPLSRFARWPHSPDIVRVNVSGVMFGGLHAMTSLGRNLLTASGSGTHLMDEIDPDGNVVRVLGAARETPQSGDPKLHRAFNNGIPLVAPDGSIYFVFTNGVPMLRKYAADGRFLFERHIEGPELDGMLQSLPAVWPRVTEKGESFPVLTATVTTAAIDAHGAVWISLGVPFTYVYDPNGNKIRTVQFRGAGLVAPTSFFFTKRGTLLITPGCYEYSVSP